MRQSSFFSPFAVARLASFGLVGTSLAGTLGLLAMPALAEEMFDNRGVLFEVNTIVEFEFLESHGAYQSTFGVVNLETGEKTPVIQEVKPADNPESLMEPSTFIDDVGRSTDFLGTPGNAVPQPFGEFEFQANVPYAFYLESAINGRVERTFYSINDRNDDNSQRVQFGNAITDLASGGVLLSWDDTGSLLVNQPEQDRDFDDFLVRAGGHLACPYNFIGSPPAAQPAQPQSQLNSPNSVPQQVAMGSCVYSPRSSHATSFDAGQP